MQLHKELLTLRHNEKELSSKILEKLQMMEEKKLYLKLGYSNLFDYLVRGLEYSGSMAYQRQSCLRLSRELPEIKEKIEAGKLTHSNLALAYRAIKGQTQNKKRQILKKIENKTFREAKKILSPMAPEVKIKQRIYQDKVILKVELSHEEYALLEKLKALKSHRFSSNHSHGDDHRHGDHLNALFMNFVKSELKQFEKTNFKASKSKNPRVISKRLRNHLLDQSNFKCQAPGCQETYFLQIDHIRPVRYGGKANPQNLQVLCGAHNRLKGVSATPTQKGKLPPFCP